MDSELADGGSGGVSLSESFQDGRDGGTTENAARPLRYEELFERVCPDYMAIGMSYDEFWNGDNEMPRMFRDAYKKREKHDRDRSNMDAWLHGVYVCRAIASCFGGKKSRSKYPDEPIKLEKDAEQPKQLSSGGQKQAEPSNRKAKQLMEAWMVNFNMKFEEKQKEKSAKTAGREVSENG